VGGFTLASVEPGHAVIRLDADERHRKPMGTVHGGILCDITDEAMGMAYTASLDEGEIVGPAYGFFGVGLALYFASQGAGRLAWPLWAGLARLLIAAIGGWLGVHWLGGGLPAVFVAMAIALVVFGTTVSLAVRLGAWRAT